jgi:hypothetical protein
MMRRTIQAAIALYPRQWRQKYGPDLEQLALEVDERRDSSPTALIFDLVRGAAAQRFRRWRRSPAIPLVFAGLVAIATVGTLGLPPATTNPPRAASKSLQNSGTQGTPTRTGSTAPPRTPSALQHGIIVRLNPTTDAVLSVTGAPAHVVMNPQTGMVLSIAHQTASG